VGSARKIDNSTKYICYVLYVSYPDLVKIAPKKMHKNVHEKDFLAQDRAQPIRHDPKGGTIFEKEVDR